MDRQEKMKKNDSSENGSDHGSNEESDNEDKVSVNCILKQKISDHGTVHNQYRAFLPRTNTRRNIKRERKRVRGRE